MSSHHIVREKQEPALFIQSLDGFDHEYLGQLLEWSPVIVVDETEYEHMHALGIKMDIVLTSAAADDLQSHVKAVHKQDGSFSSALNYLLANGHTAVNIVADVFDLKDARIFAHKISMVVLCGGRKIYAVKEGFTKWLAGGEIVRLHQPAEIFRHENLEKLNETDFRVIHDGLISLSFKEPFLFISESLG